MVEANESVSIEKEPEAFAPLLSPAAAAVSCSRVLTLRVKSNLNDVNSVLTVSSSSTILQVKEEVRSQSLGPVARGRYLRLIASGRLLAPDSAQLSEFEACLERSGNVIYAVLAAAGVRGGQQAALSRGVAPPNTRRRGVGGIVTDGLVFTRTVAADDDNDNEEDEEQANERFGFDRLRATGLTRGEISAIRLYFSRQVDRFVDQRNQLRLSNTDSNESNTTEGTNGIVESDESHGEAVETTDVRRQRLLMEDEWMAAQGPNSEFRLNLNANNPLLSSSSRFFFRDSTTTTETRSLVGTDRDFVWGFLLGFFIGFFMMFWVWMPTVPHKQKLGILTGICFQMALNLMKENNEGLADV